jgi:predicted transcriptional regulator of viral defense system
LQADFFKLMDTLNAHNILYKGILITYTIPMVLPKGIETANRKRLEMLHRQFAAPFSIAQAAQHLHLPLRETRRKMAYFASNGWLSRVKPGIYSIIPLGADVSTGWRDDPWIVAQRVFQPCYLGGWTACEHWGLTEQIFQKLVVITGQKFRHREIVIQGSSFLLKCLPLRLHFGTQVIWRGQTQVSVSDPARTLVDILDDPRLGGGIRNVAEIVATYFAQDNDPKNTLIEYSSKLGNRTIFKRLGYLLEALGIPRPDLIDICQKNQSVGLTKLDPKIDYSGRILKRWNLRINVAIKQSSPS